MRQEPLDSRADIDKIAYGVLKGSKAWGKFPTPVADIVRYAELNIEQGVDLAAVEPGFFAKNFRVFQSAIRKVIGMVDIRQKTIYLDLSQQDNRKRFVVLHETGHDVLTWQNKTYDYLDDEKTLDPGVKEIYEREASYFASESLFQAERFEEAARLLPLEIKSPMALAKQFGASNQASIRRYVERSRKRCAVLVLEKPEKKEPFETRIRNCFESGSFRKAFGQIAWPETCNETFPFVQDFKRNRRFHLDGEISLVLADSGPTTFEYHFFNNTYNAFVFMIPQGESITSRTTIYITDKMPGPTEGTKKPVYRT